LRYFYLIVTLFLLSACGESQEDKAAAQKVEAFKKEVATETPTPVPTPKPTPKIEEQIKPEANHSKKEGFMHKIGFDAKDGVISLDTNKTKGYFKELGENIKDTSKALSKDIKENTLKVTKEIGIEMDKNGSLKIDPNKTKSFMEDMGDKMENIVNDVDSFTRTLTQEKNTTH